VKTLAILLLSFILIDMVFLEFLPIPGLGIIVGFVLTPVAHALTLKELLEVNFVWLSLQTIRSLQGFFVMVNMFLPIEMWEVTWLPLFIMIALGFQIVFGAFAMTVLQRLFYHLLPKRLRLENIKL